MNLSQPWVKAMFTMMGTIMGAGLFALPVAFSKVGLFGGTALFAVLAIGMTITHIALMDEVLDSDGTRRLRYFVERRFGKVAGYLPAITYPTTLLSINYAYLLMGGSFLVMLLRFVGVTVPETYAILLFWIIFSGIAVYGLEMIAKAEVYITSAMVLSLLAMSLLQWPSITSITIPVVDPNWLLAFGVFLFSSSGISGTGEIVQIAQKKRLDARKAIVYGTLGSAALSYIFGVSFYLSSHGQITNRIIDFNSYIPAAFAMLLPVLGLSGISSSYLTASAELKMVFMRDFGYQKLQALAIAYLLPIGLYFFVSRNFVQVISFAGSVFIGMNAAMICALGYQRSMKQDPSEKRYKRVFFVVFGSLYAVSAITTILAFWRS